MAPSAIVVGAGVFGLGAALSLRERGWDVTIFERYDVPSPWGSSNDINRMVRFDYGEDEFFVDLAEQAIFKWREWNKQAVARGYKPLLNESGVIFIRKGELDGYEKDSYHTLTKKGKKLERLSAAAGKPVGSKFSGWSKGDARSYTDGYFNPVGGWANAGRTVEFMCDIAKSMGIRFKTGAAGEFVRTIEATGSQKVLGIVTADGSQHRADRILIAAGPWTPSLVPELGNLISVVGQPVIFVKVPDAVVSNYQSKQFPMFGADISRTGWYGFPADPETGNVLKLGVHGNGYITNIKMPDGRTCSVPVPGVQPPETQVEVMKKFVRETWPELKDAPVVKTKICYYCDSCDSYFYVSAVPGRENLFVATGGSGHGFKFAPVLGDVIADCLENKPNPVGEKFKWRERPQDTKIAEQCRMLNAPPEELSLPVTTSKL